MQSDRRKSLFDEAPLRLKPLRNAKLFAQRFNRFIQSESWRIRRKFEQHPARLAEVNRMKVGAVQHGRYIQMLRNFLATLYLRGVVLGAKSDVMYRTSAQASELRIGIDQQIDVIS